ncbi:MAG: hypothetical protein U0325_34810 [Polyangiales bacterium]
MAAADSSRVAEKQAEPAVMTRAFRSLLLEEIDRAWIDHLTNMDHLRDGIGLRCCRAEGPAVLEFAQRVATTCSPR